MTPIGRDPDVFPPYLYEAYRGTIRRAPESPLVEFRPTLSEVTGPGPALSAVAQEDSDLTRNAGTGAEAIGERIIVTGRVLDADGDPVPGTLIEVWQANAAGRYRHLVDQHHAPLDPNFLGVGAVPDRRAGRLPVHDDQARRLPMAQPRECVAAGAHPLLAVRHLVAGAADHADVLPRGPAARARPDHRTRCRPPRRAARLIAAYAHDVTQPQWALGYRFDIVLRGPKATPFEPFESAAQAGR